MKKLTASLLLASVLFTACKKDTASADNATTFTYRIQTTNRTSVVQRTIPAGRVQGANIQWTSGTAAATQLKFEAKSSSGEVEFKQKTAQQFDLFATASALGNVTIPAGSYNEVEFKAYLSPDGSTPALVLNGSFASGSAATPIQFIVNADVELKAEKAAITVAQGETYSALNTIDLSQLTMGITEADLSAASVTNGVVVLSSSSNVGLYNIILANLNSHHGEAEIEHH